MDLENYLSSGIENLLKDALRTSLRSPRQAAFLSQFAVSSKAAARRRREHFENDLHVPPFLIASITSSCNLHCAGCYARAGGSCVDYATSGQLSGDEWDDIFTQAEALGICFILLAGGEPLLRRDVLEKAAGHRSILFPVFTNGTMFTPENAAMFFRNRNLVPILSIEGDRVQTDTRRGEGVYEKVFSGMELLRQKNALFGASVTVTAENLREVTGDSFLQTLAGQGCRVVIFVEYVPADGVSASLAPGDEERKILADRLAELREHNFEMLLISFPGDETASGGCLAAGRGFFHIGPRGQAEPCPFSPFSDTNVLQSGLEGALRSPLFLALSEAGLLSIPHGGGCALFDQEERVRKMANNCASEL